MENINIILPLQNILIFGVVDDFKLAPVHTSPFSFENA